MTFDKMGLIDPLLQALQSEGYTQPTPIQQQAIPHLLEGRDLLGCAQTGTGKTAAFALPILQRLHQTTQPGHRAIRTLILTPTRELAIQIEESLRAYGKNLPLRHLVIFGGVGQHPQVNGLQRGVDVLVATPGRLLDLMQQGYVSLQHLEVFVLDEADRMLDMGFVHDVKRIITKLPTKRQTLFFSATMPPDIQQLANSILSNPVKVEVTPESTTADTVEQQLYFVDKHSKRHLLVELLQTNPDIKSVLVFTRTKHGADRVVKDLMRANQTAAAIHGNKSQNARQLALSNFKKGSIRILVATDIAARGIDIDDLGYVINYELPNIPETYVHRIGRTGRAGATGIAISFCENEERAYLKDIQKLIGRPIPVISEHTFKAGSPAAISAGNEQRERPERAERPERPAHSRHQQGQQRHQHQGGRAQQAVRQQPSQQRKPAPAPTAAPTQQQQAPTAAPSQRLQPGQKPRRSNAGAMPMPAAKKPVANGNNQQKSAVPVIAPIFNDEDRW